MKKTLGFLAAVFAVSCIGAGGNARAADTFSGEVRTGFTYHDRSVIQSSVTLYHLGSGAYASVWNSLSPNGRSDGGDETDYAVGIAAPVGPIGVDVGYSYLNVSGPVGYHALHLTADLPSVAGVTPFVGINKWYSSDTGTLPDYFFHRIGLKGAAKIAGQPFDLSAHVAGFVGGGRSEFTTSSRVDVSTEIDCGSGFSVTPKFSWILPLNADNVDIGRRYVVGADFKYAFPL